MHSVINAIAVCLSVCHMPILYQSSGTDRAGFLAQSYPLLILHSVVREFGISKIRVLPSGTLSKTFCEANVSAFSPWYIICCKCCQ